MKKKTTTRHDLQGWYELVYSPHDGGWYAMLWWNDRISPIYKKPEGAREWAILKGGELSKEQLIK